MWAVIGMVAFAAFAGAEVESRHRHGIPVGSPPKPNVYPMMIPQATKEYVRPRLWLDNHDADTQEWRRYRVVYMERCG